MSLNFNTQPYYDDFDENKNFHKILFKPGVAVQARELTQAQSILQDQIGKFGKFVLSDGSNVTGGQYSIDTNAKSLKLQNLGSLETDIENFTGLYIVGSTSKCVGLVSDADIVNFYLTIKPITNIGVNFVSGETLQLFVSKGSALAYTGNSSIVSDYSATLSTDTVLTISNVYGQKNSYTFQLNSSSIELGDVITFDSFGLLKYIVVDIGADGTFTVDQKLRTDYVNSSATITKYASRTVMEVGIADGVYFTNNHFVKALAQTIIPDLRTQYPSCVIGFEVIETIVDFVDDTSLLDPAQGSYNYTAPGADRYKIYLQLVSKNLTTHGGLNSSDWGIADLTTTKFIELLRIRNGIVIRDNTDPKLGELENTLARQMYDHAGNFIVKPYKVSFQESNFSDAANTVVAEISPGKAYVFGYEFDATFPTYLTIQKARDTDSISNYTTTAYYGNYITVNSVNGTVPNPKSGSKIELHSTVKGGTVDANTRIGYAYVRNIEYVTTGEYNLHLYNISAPQAEIANTKSIFLLSGSSYSTAAFSANVVQENSTTTFVDPGFNKLLFELPYKNVASLSGTSITLDVFDTITVTNNTASISTGSSNIIFPSGLSANLSSDLKNSHFLISTKTTNGDYVAGNYVNLSQVGIETKIQSGQTANFTFYKKYTGQIDIKYGLTYNNAQPKTKTLHTNYVSQVKTDVYPKSLGIADITEFKGVFKSTDNDAIFIGAYNSGTSYNKSDVVQYGNSLYVSTKSSNLGVSPDGTTPNWNKLRDVTNNYILDNGQTENMYDHGTVTAKTSTDSGTVFVLFDYYTHSSDGQYISYQSYPVDYSQIPTVSIKGNDYNLTNYVDFRPRRTNLIATNITYDTYQIPSTDFTGFEFDMSYYLGRIDKLVLTKDKRFSWIKGKPSYSNYVPPVDLSDAMTLATIQFNPFTVNESDIIIKYQKHRRYTMDDIGKLDTRISNVEYYTSLNLVEKDVMSRNIVDNVVGSRMKNGFVVDPFIGYNVMSLADNYKNISLDLDKQLARPSFTTKYSNITTKNIGTLYEQNGLVSFPIVEEVQIVFQYLPTGTTKINLFDSISYAGDLFLSPQSDVWVDTENKPIINVLNDNAAAIRDASSVPGLLFNEWNTFYATHPYKELSGSVDVIYNNVDYKVSTVAVVQSDITEEIENSVIPYARSIPIKFKATQLAPLTKMYVYVNGRLVNAYVQPTTNPRGVITGAHILNPGTGYTTNPTLALSATQTIPANVSFDLFGTTINGVEITNKGLGYSTETALAPTITGGGGTSATINLSTVLPVAGDLYTDERGTCEGILNLPNDSLLKFPTGELLITVCDTPNYDYDTYAISKAQATFFSSGRHKTYQETITSIREPYITKVGNITQPEPEKQNRIVVQSQVNYLTNHYAKTYDQVKIGSLTLPVYLSSQPTSDVVVTFMDASEDKSANSSVSFSTVSLTFTTTNYATPQNVTFNYDLGIRKYVNGKYVDNNLPTYIEYYGESADVNYNYSATVKPIRYWQKNVIIPGVATTKLFPYSVRDPNEVLAESTPYLEVSPIQTSVAEGKSFFTVTYGGGSKIGWWSLNSGSTYPLTFTAVSSNTSVFEVKSSSYEHYDVIDDVKGAVRTVNKSDQEVLVFKYYLACMNAGTANVTVTTTSTEPSWNNLKANTVGIVTAALGTPDKSIVVHPNVTSSATQGTIYNADRITTESGGTHTFSVSLSAPPTQPVKITADSLSVTEGIITANSENGLNFLTGNTVTFTATTWNTIKAFVVTGVQDYLQDGTVDYNIRLKATSSDTAYNNLIANVALMNQDVIVPKGEAVATILGTSHTNEKYNGKVYISVVLNKKPNASQIVTVDVASTDTTEGVVTSPVGGKLYFNENTWNIPQTIEVTGQSDLVFDGDTTYYISLATSTPTFSEFSNSIVYVKLINDDYVYKTDLLITTDNSSRTYSAIPKGRSAAAWLPAFSVSGAHYGGGGYISSASGFTATIASSTKNSVTIKASAYIGALNNSDHGNFSGWAWVSFYVSTTNNDTLISKSATVSTGQIDSASRTTKSIKISVPVYNGGGSGTFSSTVTLTGLYYDAIGAGFDVTETLTSTTSTTVIRLDDYAIIDQYDTTTNPQQSVPWDKNAESKLAAYNTVKSYPLSSTPGEGFVAPDAASVATSANLFRKDNLEKLIAQQQKLVDNIVAKIKALGNNVPTSTLTTALIEQNYLSDLQLKLQKL